MTAIESPLVASFNALPNDLVIDVIVPNLNFSDINNLISSSNIYGSRTEDLYKIAIDNDSFLKRYLARRSCMNLISTIHKSSFTLNGFFAMYDNVNNDVKADDSFPHLYPNPIGYSGRNSRYELSQICIDATFELFKILMSCTMYHLKFQFRNYITTRMVKYFKNVFNARHRDRKDICKEIFFSFIKNRDDLSWHTSNINLYYMYENMNLMYYAKRSYVLKKNLETFDDGTIAMTHDNHVNTLVMMINIFPCLPTTELKIYAMYTIFKYIKVILANRSEVESTDNFNLDKFVIVIKEKIKEFKFDLNKEHRSLIPHYLRKIMIDHAKSVEELVSSDYLPSV
jgi:hypothetical protein